MDVPISRPALRAMQVRAISAVLRRWSAGSLLLELNLRREHVGQPWGFAVLGAVVVSVTRGSIARSALFLSLSFFFFFFFFFFLSLSLCLSVCLSVSVFLSLSLSLCLCLCGIPYEPNYS
jgi:hypothetical protein